MNSCSWQAQVDQTRRDLILISRAVFGASLIQDSGWPEPFPHWNLILMVKLSNSSIKSICFIAFFSMLLLIYHCSSPSWSWSVLVKLQYHQFCNHSNPILCEFYNISHKKSNITKKILLIKFSRSRKSKEASVSIHLYIFTSLWELGINGETA